MLCEQNILLEDNGFDAGAALYALLVQRCGMLVLKRCEEGGTHRGAATPRDTPVWLLMRSRHIYPACRGST